MSIRRAVRRPTPRNRGSESSAWGERVAGDGLAWTQRSGASPWGETPLRSLRRLLEAGSRRAAHRADLRAQREQGDDDGDGDGGDDQAVLNHALTMLTVLESGLEAGQQSHKLEDRSLRTLWWRAPNLFC